MIYHDSFNEGEIDGSSQLNILKSSSEAKITPAATVVVISSCITLIGLTALTIMVYRRREI